ncbi:MAG: hypothetical protein LBD23_20405 [Oscillospiraceae bacterium]|nr:hypothetical protein [Oscillospiraceae bacterium]
MKKFLSPEFQNHIWILISTIIAAPFMSVLVLITTRLVDLETAGMLYFAASVTSLFIVFAVFSVNQIQMVDVREENKFIEYLGFRTATSAAATLAIILYLVVAGYEWQQTTVILLYYIFLLIDAYANVFMTDFHQKGMIRIMGRMRASGFAASLIAFFLVVYTTRDVTISLMVAGVLLTGIYMAWIWTYKRHFGAIRVKADYLAIKRLAASAFPVLVLTLIMTYLGYAPSIYLGTFDSYEKVAIYAILITPSALYLILVHALLLGAPLPQTSEAYASGQLKRFSKRIHVLLFIGIIMAIPFLAVTYIIGILLLSWLYDTDLSTYLRQLMLVSAGGVFTTATPIVGMALIIMRKQKAYMYSYLAVGAVAGPLVGVLVWRYGILGAAFSNLVVFAPLTIVVYIVFRCTLRRENASAHQTYEQ